MPERYERQFLDALENLFTGAEVEGKFNPAHMDLKEKMHFINLMRPYLWWGE